MTQSGNAAQLRTLLLQERADLINGRLEGLESTADKKQALVQALAASPPPANVVDELRNMLVHNASLLQAASDGVRTVMDILKAVHAAQNVTTYGADGARHMVRPTGSKLQRKA